MFQETKMNKHIFSSKLASTICSRSRRSVILESLFAPSVTSSECHPSHTTQILVLGQRVQASIS